MSCASLIRPLLVTRSLSEIYACQIVEREMEAEPAHEGKQ